MNDAIERLGCHFRGWSFSKEEAEYIYLCLAPCFMVKSGYMLKLEKEEKT